MIPDETIREYMRRRVEVLRNKHFDAPRLADYIAEDADNEFNLTPCGQVEYPEWLDILADEVVKETR